MSKNGSPPYVGYMHPPEHTRFKKGKSGNPRGRPRKQQNTNTVLERVLSRNVRVADQEKRIPIRDALMRKLRELALQGDKRAIAMLRRILDEAGVGAPEDDIPNQVRNEMLNLLVHLGMPTDHLRGADDT
ncbi:MAG: DUF5681 domain-containing protein [Pseudomonadota bacterium]